MVDILAGGAGFIGINIAKKLSKKKSKVFILDNLSNANKKELNKLVKLSNIEFIECDLSIVENTKKIFKSITQNGNKDITLWHLAANSDIPSGINNPIIDWYAIQREFCKYLKAKGEHIFLLRQIITFMLNH